MRDGDSQLRSVHLVFDTFSETRDQTALIRIIGIGSPFGDDAAGLEIARVLAEAPPPNCEVIVADRPGMALVDLMEGCRRRDSHRRGAFGCDRPERSMNSSSTNLTAVRRISSLRTIWVSLRQSNSLKSWDARLL